MAYFCHNLEKNMLWDSFWPGLCPGFVTDPQMQEEGYTYLNKFWYAVSFCKLILEDNFHDPCLVNTVSLWSLAPSPWNSHALQSSALLSPVPPFPLLSLLSLLPFGAVLSSHSASLAGCSFSITHSLGNFIQRTRGKVSITHPSLQKMSFHFERLLKKFGAAPEKCFFPHISTVLYTTRLKALAKMFPLSSENSQEKLWLAFYRRLSRWGSHT